MDSQHPAHGERASAEDQTHQRRDPSPAIGRALVAVVLVHGIPYLDIRGVLSGPWSSVPLTLGAIALDTGLGISAVVTAWRAPPNNKGRTRPGHLIAVVLGLAAFVPGLLGFVMGLYVWWRFLG